MARNTAFPWPVFLEECQTYLSCWIMWSNRRRMKATRSTPSVFAVSRKKHQRTSFPTCETCRIKFFPGYGLGAGDRSNGHHNSRSRRTTIFFPPRVIWSHLVTTPTHVPLTELTENTRAATTETTPHTLGQDWPTSPHKQTAEFAMTRPRAALVYTNIKKKDWLIVCCQKSAEFQFLNSISANKVACYIL